MFGTCLSCLYGIIKLGMIIYWLIEFFFKISQAIQGFTMVFAGYIIIFKEHLSEVWINRGRVKEWDKDKER